MCTSIAGFAMQATVILTVRNAILKKKIENCMMNLNTHAVQILSKPQKIKSAQPTPT
jgi:hypothetical protein